MRQLESGAGGACLVARRHVPRCPEACAPSAARRRGVVSARMAPRLMILLCALLLGGCSRLLFMPVAVEEPQIIQLDALISGTSATRKTAVRDIRKNTVTWLFYLPITKILPYELQNVDSIFTSICGQSKFLRSATGPGLAPSPVSIEYIGLSHAFATEFASNCADLRWN